MLIEENFPFYMRLISVSIKFLMFPKDSINLVNSLLASHSNI